SPGGNSLFEGGELAGEGPGGWIVKAPLVDKGGLIVVFRFEGGNREHLWLEADSMDEAEWRDLRRILLQQETQR
ncbi:hypothetical protein KCA24_11020, partial [Escherichia coli]|nr:hypothetical protein [Escherichia coli]